MALPLMEQIEAETRAGWPVTDVRLVHRLGRLEIGEASVAVAVASPHRAEAFAACRYAIDTLKAKVPIWKKEFYADGALWLEGARPTSEVRHACLMNVRLVTLALSTRQDGSFIGDRGLVKSGYPPIWNMARSSVEMPSSSRWPVGFAATARERICATAASPPPPRSAAFTSSSSSFSRQRWNLPSAVRRMRLQDPQ